VPLTPRSTLFPYTTLFRSPVMVTAAVIEHLRSDVELRSLVRIARPVHAAALDVRADCAGVRLEIRNRALRIDERRPALAGGEHHAYMSADPARVLAVNVRAELQHGRIRIAHREARSGDVEAVGIGAHPCVRRPAALEIPHSALIADARA